MPDFTDAELVTLLLKQDRKAIRFFIDTYTQPIFGICLQFFANKEEAEDITQEVFVKALEKLSAFRIDAKLSTWLYRIATNACLEEIRKKKRKKRFAFFTTINEEATSISSDDIPDKVLEEKENIALLYKAIDALPEKQRTAFALRQMEDMTYKEIAEIMNTSQSSVESLLFRARSTLKTELDHLKK